MKIFGYSRKGFLYIDTGITLISQQTTSFDRDMVNKYASLTQYKNYDEAEDAYYKQKVSITNIDRNFQEAMINDMDMGQDI